MGILRMVGMRRVGVIHLLLIQAFSYSVPAWIFGIAAAAVRYSAIHTFHQSFVPPFAKLLTHKYRGES